MKLYVGFNMLASREQWTSFAGGIILKNEFFILAISHFNISYPSFNDNN